MMLRVCAVPQSADQVAGRAEVQPQVAATIAAGTGRPITGNKPTCETVHTTPTE